MSGRFRDGEHFLRAAALLVALSGLFLLARGLLVPEDFGTFGHYRAGALTENAMCPLVFAGCDACVECHADVDEVRQGSGHAAIGCEACHGALAGHAEDPGASLPQLPDPAELCARCHARSAARPAGFPQVEAAEHAGGEACASCHRPHHPAID